MRVELFQLERETGIRYDLMESMIELGAIEVYYHNGREYLEKSAFYSFLNDLIQGWVTDQLAIDDWYVSEYSKDAK